jgi:hypothetical protein
VAITSVSIGINFLACLYSYVIWPKILNLILSFSFQLLLIVGLCEGHYFLAIISNSVKGVSVFLKSKHFRNNFSTIYATFIFSIQLVLIIFTALFKLTNQVLLDEL